MKRLIKTIDLRFFQDDATGDTGLTHADTMNENGDGFNAFWNGIGIFHDVFEHSHEYTNKYFRGDYALNIGGEMTAMGAMWYYYDVLGIGNRMNSGAWRTPSESMKRTTMDEVQEAISNGYCRYGVTLTANVPKQSPVYNGELEYQISEFWKEAQKFRLDVQSEDEREKEFSRNYRKSVTFRKIADLHRYGFRMAEKLVPDNWDNGRMLYDFIEYWNEFCKSYNAKEMADMFFGITIKIYKEDDRISWKATFNSRDKYSFKDVTIKAGDHFSIEDAWIIEETY